MVLVLIAYWPLLQYSMKFDILDQYLPWRYLVGLCLQSGHLALWNPYTHLGYPLYADPQSGAWYPVVWLIGGLHGYNIYWIQAEFLFHVWLAGCGMFLLIHRLLRNSQVAWLAGASYLLSGFFTGNAQHLTWIISGAWIPFILYFFLLMSETGKFKDCLKCALVFFMLFTGGYPAFTILMVYILIFLSAVIIIRKKRKITPLVKYLKLVSFFAITILLLSAVMLVSVFESFRIAGRAEGLSRELAMANPFSPQSMLSWLLPFSSVKDPEFFNTDISMSNGYFGLLMLVAVLVSLFRKKSFLENITLAGSIFFLIAAMGSYMPLRGWMYDYLPFMNLFRMPGLFRLFATIGFIVLGSFTLSDVTKGYPVIKNMLAGFKIVFIIFIGVMISELVKGIDWNLLNADSYVPWLVNLKFNESVFLQAAIQLISILVLFLCISNRKYIYWLVIDGVLACWLCAPVTIVSERKIGDVFKLTEQMPGVFRIPDLTPMNQNKDRMGIVGPFWCNLGIWKMQPIWDGYNNFQTKEFLNFERSPIAEYVLKNPIIYCSSNQAKVHHSFTDILPLINDSTLLYVDDTIQEPEQESYLETIILSKPQLTMFTPQIIEATLNNPVTSYLTLMQQNRKGWKVFTDGNEQKTFISNGLFISIKVPAGKHHVSYIFNDKEIVNAFYISVIALLLTLILLLTGKKTNPGLSTYF